ncbi:MAG: hypothetical protein ACPG32_16075, partial [Akkermansiaceae bacterium]
PWHPNSTVWRADLWGSERTLWEQLRYGQWEKPQAILIRCDDAHEAQEYISRGWRVSLYEHRCAEKIFSDVCHP